MDGTRPSALTDVQLDRELEAALGVEPSPEFLARVRTRIASERRAAGESGFSRMLQRAVEPMWAVALVGIVVAVVVPQWIRDGEPRATVTDRRPLTPLPMSDGSDFETEASAGGMGRAAGVATIATPAVARTQERLRGTPAVLISQDDRRAFDALLVAVAENRLPVRTPPVEGTASALAIAPLQIQQLRIEPLQLSGLGGENGS